jgi:hypothetical protein
LRAYYCYDTLTHNKFKKPKEEVIDICYASDKEPLEKYDLDM